LPPPQSSKEVALSRPVQVAALIALAAALTCSAQALPAERVKRFDLTAMKFHFEPGEVAVDQGDHVVLSLHSNDVKHGFRLKPYGIKTVIPKGGAVVIVEFTADKPGTFSFSCSEYCGPRHGSMKGRLVVHPRAQ
jgi:heme/copper-type cytochrome/quinol oxidase subunit 2